MLYWTKGQYELNGFDRPIWTPILPAKLFRLQMGRFPYMPPLKVSRAWQKSRPKQGETLMLNAFRKKLFK